MLTGFLCLTVTFTCFRCVFIEESTCAGQLSDQLETGWLWRGEKKNWLLPNYCCDCAGDLCAILELHGDSLIHLGPVSRKHMKAPVPNVSQSAGFSSMLYAQHERFWKEREKPPAILPKNLRKSGCVPRILSTERFRVWGLAMSGIWNGSVLLSFMVRDRSSPPRPSQPPLLGFESKRLRRPNGRGTGNIFAI